MEEEDIDMETVHDSQAFIHHHLNLLERPSTPGKYSHGRRNDENDNQTPILRARLNAPALVPF